MIRVVVKTSTHIVKQAEIITLKILVEIRQTLDFRGEDDCTFWAMCLVAFMLMLRKSNLVPDTPGSFEKNKQLTRGHLKFVQGAVWVTITWSKTLQFHLKQLRFPLLQIEGSALCPVRALQTMVRSIPLASDKPCFAQKNGQPWTYRQFQDKLRQCLDSIGYRSELFSSHSMRRGGCSFCFQSGVPSELIQVIGDWRSDVYRNYCKMDKLSQVEACARFRKELLKLAI